MKKIIVLVVAIGAVLFVGTKVASAIPLIPIPQQIHPIDPDIFKKWHCGNIKAKLDEKSDFFAQKREGHMAAFNNLKSRLDTLINRLDDNGYDTAQIKADREVLDEKIDDFSEDYEKFKDKISSFKGSVCDDDSDKIKENSGELRTLMQEIKKDAKDIHDYYENELRDDIKEVRKK